MFLLEITLFYNVGSGEERWQVNMLDNNFEPCTKNVSIDVTGWSSIQFRGISRWKFGC